MTEHKQVAQLWLGTLVEIRAEAPSRTGLQSALDNAFAAIARVHNALSVHQLGSEISQINCAAVHAVQSISEDFRTVLHCALELAEYSDGVFDPTIGGTLAAWGLLPQQPEAVTDASWRDIELTSQGVFFKRPLVLDFGGIAKGYAVDCAINALRESGATAGCVNAGGDLAVFGSWNETIHVRVGGSVSGLLPLLELTEGAVATSAYATHDIATQGTHMPRRVTSLVDPRNRAPCLIESTVSVVATSCMLADALTKVIALRSTDANSMLAIYGASAAVLTSIDDEFFHCEHLPNQIPQSGVCSDLSNVRLV